jgi:hypothetical protein
MNIPPLIGIFCRPRSDSAFFTDSLEQEKLREIFRHPSHSKLFADSRKTVLSIRFMAD